MPPRSLGSGTISFGLVSIPVKLYQPPRPNPSASICSMPSAAIASGNSASVRYAMKSWSVRVWSKGYEFAKDQYVKVSDEELEALEGEASKAIEISEFVPLSKVDPVYFEKSYYLGPDKGGEKAYRLLSDAMTQAGKVALAKFVLRGRKTWCWFAPHKMD